MTTNDKLRTARAFIKQGDYHQARKLLLTIRHHPTAKEWLLRLENMSTSTRTQMKSRQYRQTRV